MLTRYLSPYLQSQLKSIQRLDILLDRYIPNSLENSTRENRGQCVRRKVTADVVLPKNWNSFLRCDDNKKELFPFLSKAGKTDHNATDICYSWKQ